jgi:hypothetical protein
MLRQRQDLMQEGRKIYLPMTLRVEMFLTNKARDFIKSLFSGPENLLSGDFLKEFLFLMRALLIIKGAQKKRAFNFAITQERMYKKKAAPGQSSLWGQNSLSDS